MDRDLLTDFISAYPAQPATAYWRAVEIGALLRQPLPDGRGLDLGCGDGKLTRIILDRTGARDLVGVDMDPQETAVASRAGLYREVLTADATALPVPDGCFDFVVSNSVLEHIPNLEAVIAEVGRVLRRGGIFITTVPTVGFHGNLKGSLLPWIKRRDYLSDLDARLAHFHYLTSEQWAEMLERHGMSLKHRFGYLDAEECRRWETLSRLTGGLLHAVTLKRSRPIEIQRSLGLRGFQSRHGLPKRLARLLAGLIRTDREDRPGYWRTQTGLDDQHAGCLMIDAVRS